MKIQSSILLNDLKEKTFKMIHQVESFKHIPENQLNHQPAENKWSVLKCIGHLNFYSDFYIKEFENRILSAKHSCSEFHKTGFIGNKFAKSMLPTEDGIPMKIKTFKSKTPKKSELSITTIDKFLKQQKEIVQLIGKSREVCLTRTKCNITIKFIKLRFGDALRFYTFHNIRHIVQAAKVIGKNFEF